MVDHYLSFEALDLVDIEAKLFALSSEVTHVFWVAIQFRHHEEETISVNSLSLSNVLRVLTIQKTSSSFSSTGKVIYITLQTGAKHYMGPILTKSDVATIMPHEPPFREDMHGAGPLPQRLLCAGGSCEILWPIFDALDPPVLDHHGRID